MQYNKRLKNVAPERNSPYSLPWQNMPELWASQHTSGLDLCRTTLAFDDVLCIPGPKPCKGHRSPCKTPADKVDLSLKMSSSYAHPSVRPSKQNIPTLGLTPAAAAAAAALRPEIDHASTKYPQQLYLKQEWLCAVVCQLPLGCKCGHLGLKHTADTQGWQQ
jgi:hypothetical protein